MEASIPHISDIILVNDYHKNCFVLASEYSVYQHGLTPTLPPLLPFNNNKHTEILLEFQLLFFRLIGNVCDSVFSRLEYNFQARPFLRSST